MKTLCIISPFVVALLSSLGSYNVACGFQNRAVAIRQKYGASKAPAAVGVLSMKGGGNDAYKMAAEQMKNMKPEDIDKMIEEMDNMNPLQSGALKAMGMDPEMMKKTMKMMKENPAMIETAQKLMDNMTPEQLAEQSKQAQERMKNMSPEQLETMNQAMNEIPSDQLDKAVEVISQQAAATTTTSTTGDVAAGPGSSSDPSVIDAMFKVGCLMSDPPTDSCTFAGFAAVPIIQLLKGDRDVDLSASELRECWEDGSLGATRVDRAGFERVWKEVQDYFEEDIMGEARKEAKKLVATKKRRGSSAPKPPSTPNPTTVGANMSKEQLAAVNDRVKNLSNDDMDTMLSMMEKMDPAQEARMKDMGVDPAMMRKTAQMMKDNPMMRDAAKKMLGNMSPEEMLQNSQRAQAEMSNMSKEEIEKTLEEAEKAAFNNPKLKDLDL